MDGTYSSPPDEDDDEQLVKHLTTHNQHHDLPPTSTPKPFSEAEYRSASSPVAQPASGPERLDTSNGTTARLKALEGASPDPQGLHQGSIDQQSFPRQPYDDVAHTPLFPSTPSDAGSAVSPRLPGTPQQQPTILLPSYTPGDRSLPSREVTDETIDDAYVAFILYCNPVVSPVADSTELRRGFRAPPKSDGKTFSTYTLLELIRKFESKEIRTWTQLAIQLGVEPPVIEKNQSAQKVQQYAVRLKRWMHAMHVDAFFEYCLGKPHSYYTQVPPLHAPYPEFGRDGVPLEEDLALRAMHPDSRPKRGRRKAEGKEGEVEQRSSPAKRPHLDTTVVDFGSPRSGGLLPHSPLPTTAQADDMDHYVGHLDPWAAASAVTPGSVSAGTPHPSSANPASAGGQQFRWRLNTRDTHSPSTPHPLSTVTPSTGHPPDSGFDEPHSAITPSSTSSKGRARRRHGPAVSSAWPSSGNPLTGKLRGRPPSNRSVRDGPFSTFPANPKTREGPIIDLQGSTPVSTPISESGRCHTAGQRASNPAQQAQGRPTSLHLRVPQNTGGPVRLATPTVLLNGATDHVPPSFPSERTLGVAEAANGPVLPQENDHVLPRIGLDDVIRALTTKFLRADVVGGPEALDLELAKRLATRVVELLRVSHDGAGRGDDAVSSLPLSLLMNTATCFGLFPDLGIHPVSGSFLRTVRIRAPPTSNGSNDASSTKKEGAGVYSITWTLQCGPLTGDFSLDVPLDAPAASAAAVDSADGVSGDARHWKKRFQELQEKSEHDMSRLRKAVLDAPPSRPARSTAADTSPRGL
ncbi:MAG: hypothetical protein M1832_002554 [Thelocarpon impressellum]|nr:MAG: hypothetical protein M1832_002554 [Thelocarpon impressellum]